MEGVYKIPMILEYATLVIVIVLMVSGIAMVVKQTIEIKKYKRDERFQLIEGIARKDIVLFDIAAYAENHEVGTIPAGSTLIIKGTEKMVDGRWYYVESGNISGYCHAGSILL